MKSTLKIIHTADIHLGAKFIGLGTKGAEQRRCLRECVSTIVDYAIEEKADLVLIAGDAFDSQQPSPESITALSKGINRLAAVDIPVLMIAGTHDSLEKNGILKRWIAQQNHVVLLTPEQPVWMLEEKQVCVQGVSLHSTTEPKRPLRELTSPKENFWNIGMIHAALEMGRDNPQEAVFTQQEISESGFDYLALGHWHRQRDCSKGKTVAWYSGSPEMIAFDEAEPGVVLKIDFVEGQTPLVTPRVVGKRALVDLSLQAYDSETIISKAREYADCDKILTLRLSGVAPPELFPDLDEIAKALEDDYFYVRIKNDLSAMIGKDELGHFSDQTVIGKFVQIVEEGKKEGTVEERAELDRVLQLGLSLLSGREVPPCS